MNSKQTRRDFISKSGIKLGAAAIAASSISGVILTPGNRIFSIPSEEDVSPAEDLMREHGVLKRIMLVYQEIMDRIKVKSQFPSEAVSQSVEIIRKFIEDYHEKLEETYLFPRFRKANTLVELVDVLETQHRSGRVLTDKILSLTKTGLKKEEDKNQLSGYLHSFNRMFSPHEAREDTVLFPAFKKIVTSNEYDSLGDDFENKEHELFGKDGFEGMVDKTASIEKMLGIYELSYFTPDGGVL